MSAMSSEFSDTSWFRILIRTDSPDLVSDVLVQHFDLGGTEVREASNPAIVVAYIDQTTFDSPDAVETALIQRLDESAPTAESTVAAVEPYSDTDWATAWRKHFGPVDLSPRIRVGPPWEDFEAPESGDSGVPTSKIVIDPGMAFGTGTHETTQLAATLLDSYLLHSENRPSVLDVGTGSGILAIVAAKLGAASVRGIDISDDAIEAARRNADANDVADVTSFSTTPITDIDRQYPLVVANMLSHILCDIRDPLLDSIAPGGTLVLSGLTVDESDQFVSDFFPEAFSVADTRSQGDWLALLSNPGDAPDPDD